MEDLLEQANEIQESLGRSYAVPDEIDEADLEAGTPISMISSRQADAERMLELDALQLEEEEEGPSYLADLNKAPDFVDEAPVEIAEASLSTMRTFCNTHPWISDSREGSSEDRRIIWSPASIISGALYHSIVTIT